MWRPPSATVSCIHRRDTTIDTFHHLVVDDDDDDDDDDGGDDGDDDGWGNTRINTQSINLEDDENCVEICSTKNPICGRGGDIYCSGALRSVFFRFR